MSDYADAIDHLNWQLDRRLADAKEFLSGADLAVALDRIGLEHHDALRRAALAHGEA